MCLVRGVSHWQKQAWALNAQDVQEDNVDRRSKPSVRIVSCPPTYNQKIWSNDTTLDQLAVVKDE
jgi:hypothetical protein